LVFVDREGLASRYPGIRTDTVPQECVAALVLRVADLATARAALSTVPAVALANGIAIAPDHATGVILRLEG